MTSWSTSQSVVEPQMVQRVSLGALSSECQGKANMEIGQCAKVLVG